MEFFPPTKILKFQNFKFFGSFFQRFPLAFLISTGFFDFEKMLAPDEKILVYFYTNIIYNHKPPLLNKNPRENILT